MATASSRQNRQEGIAISICGIFIFGPLFYILATQFLLQGKSANLEFGWLLLLWGTAVLAFTTTTKYIGFVWRRAEKTDSTETEMGLIGLGLGLVSPLPMLAYYFYAVAILSGIIVFAKIFIFKVATDPKHSGPVL